MTSKDGLYKQVFKNGASSETLRILLSELKKEGNPGKVIQECIRAIQIYPEDLFLRRLLAESYLEAGFISQAEMELERLTSQIDELVSPYKLLANIYRKQHRAEDAIRNLRIYLSHRPEDHEALGVFESLHAQPPMVMEEMPVPEIEEEAAAPEIHESVVGEQGEVSDEAPVSEIATPTLAEVYASQGDVVEALNIYHKVVDRNRQDERSGQRIKELEALLTRETAVPEKEVDGKRKKKERAIAILEAWLADLRRMYQDSATA
jgi:tetratricopeptide (TPR) repeat protein